jgi:catechol 2,3-dioxygenase-like lactoylglutathione lyase family enzyme
MPPFVHLHLHVRDLARSRDFYERFLGVAPRARATTRSSSRASRRSTSRCRGAPRPRRRSGHVGLQLDRPGLRAELARVRAAGLALREEMGVDCCYANQDKFWVSDPDGVEWEVYFLRRDVPARSATLPTVDTSTESCCVRTESGEMRCP